jgi:antitoxin (DNA-binding transcriptional repressor) of toxin-antitoxin stability system
MKAVSMLDFRKRADSVLRQIGKGQSFVLTYRGKPVARLEPFRREAIDAEDPIYRLAELASDAAGPLTNAQIDQILYGG